MNVYFNPESENPFRMAELNELQEFMANFDPEVDVIWGAAFDPSLDERIKITVLAAGFNVSLDKEAPTPMPVRSSRIQAPETPTRATTENANARLKDEYGEELINKMELAQNSARYIIFTPDWMDDDEVIDLIEKTPTYRRKPDFRNQIRERQNNTAAAQTVAEAPKAAKRSGDGGGVIDFGE